MVKVYRGQRPAGRGPQVVFAPYRRIHKIYIKGYSLFAPRGIWTDAPER
jgi:hypothetical protein